MGFDFVNPSEVLHPLEYNRYSPSYSAPVLRDCFRGDHLNVFVRYCILWIHLIRYSWVIVSYICRYFHPSFQKVIPIIGILTSFPCRNHKTLMVFPPAKLDVATLVLLLLTRDTAIRWWKSSFLFSPWSVFSKNHRFRFAPDFPF